MDILFVQYVKIVLRSGEDPLEHRHIDNRRNDDAKKRIALPKMQGNTDGTSDYFRQTVWARQNFRVAEAIDNQHADDGGADDGTKIENDFRWLLAAAKRRKNKATNSVSHQKHDNYSRPKV